MTDAAQEWYNIMEDQMPEDDDIDHKIIANIIVAAIDAATTQEWEVFESKLGNLNLDLFVKENDDEINDSFLYHTILLNNLPKIIEFFKEM
jgi:hypothetical protein